jgi:hypothetical protein
MQRQDFSEASSLQEKIARKLSGEYKPSLETPVAVISVNHSADLNILTRSHNAKRSIDVRNGLETEIARQLGVF